MRCEEVVDILLVAGDEDTLPIRAAREHLGRCSDCAAALTASRILSAEADAPIPRLTEGAFDRALQRAVFSRRTDRPTRNGFWLGTAVGGALAASLAAAAVLLWLQVQSPTPQSAAVANPEVRLALNELHPVSVSLDAPEALQGAEIHIVLTGAIGLDGFGAQRELRWIANLDQGVNQLTLPLIATGLSGGQVLVEVVHAEKRRAFVVDVQAIAEPSAATSPSAAVGSKSA